MVPGTKGEDSALASVRLWAWAQLATVVAGTTGESATLASVRLCAWAQPDNLVPGTTGDGLALPYVPSFGVGPISHCDGGHER